MKNLIWTLFVLTILSSCKGVEWCNEHYPQVASIDSIYIQELDTVKIAIPGDSVITTIKVPCDNFELIQENGKLLQSLKVVNGILKQRLIIKPDTVTKFVTNTITKTNIVKVPEKIKYVPKFWKVAGWTGIISILIVMGYFGFKIKRFIP